MAGLLAPVIFVMMLIRLVQCQDSGCGSLKSQTGTSGTIASMNYPTVYNPYSKCEWVISAPGYRLRIHFNQTFHVQLAIDCWLDHIITKQGNKITGTRCGTTAPPDIFPSGSAITVEFKSDGSLQYSGFSATWTAFSAVMGSGCGGPRFLSSKSGTISSMNYPNKYSDSTSCSWFITVPLGYYVNLKFDAKFDLESCNDIVTVSGYGTFCGTTAPSDKVMNTNEVSVAFTSDTSTAKTGFSLTWTAIHVDHGNCGDSVQTGMRGSITSRNYPNSYDANANCVWRIEVTLGYRVLLHVNGKFNLEAINDLLTVYEESSASVSYGPYSGTSAPPDILSEDTDLIVTFKSNHNDQREGFNITWTAVQPVSKKFGPNSGYTCHCLLDIQCDTTSGVCPNGRCAQGWYGDYCQTGNAAYSRPAAQSSTYGGNSATAADKAVDNNRNQLMSGGSCTHTADPPLDNQPWWRVDLGLKFALLNLTLYNRGNDGCQSYPSCRDRLKNFKIWMTDIVDTDPTKGSICLSYPGTVSLGAKQQLTCDPPVVGRYLYIKLMDDKTALSLCEVVIHAFQYRLCSGQKYGPNCNHRCRCTDRSEQCNSASGACTSNCTGEFDGKYCEKLLPYTKQAPTVKSKTGFSISISTPAWSNTKDGGDGTVVKYKLQYKEKSSSQWINDTTAYPASSIASSSWNVTGLKDFNTVYQFRVVLFNDRTYAQDQAWGKPGAALEARTLCPPIVIPNITEITTGIDTSKTWPRRAYLLVKIEDFINAGMPSVCFKHFFVYRNNGGSQVKTLTFHYKMEDILAYTNFNVYIELYDKDGRKATSKTVVKKTAEDTPDKVTNLRSTQKGKTLKVTWSPPSLPYGVITAYFVGHRLSGYGNCAKVNGALKTWPALTADKRSYVIPENVMCPYCRYNITVKAATAVSQGVEAELTNEITAKAAPTATPPTPVENRKTAREISFSWASVSCQIRNGPKVWYNYQLLKPSGEPHKTSTTYNLQTRITGLSPYTSYRFRVAYTNDAGIGPYSANVTVRTNEDFPGQVATINTMTTSIDITIKWGAPSSPNGVIQYYTVRYNHRGYGPANQCPVTTNWVDRNTTGPVTEYLLTTSCPFCRYDIELLAVNGAGPGPTIGEINLQMKPAVPTVLPPLPKVDSTSSRQITFSLKPMKCEYRNGPPGSYHYTLTPAAGNVKSGNVTATSVQVTGLVPYMNYSFRIAFRNVVGLGPYRSAVTVTTEEEVPRAPDITKAGSKLDSISVKVTPPNPPHAKIMGFTIEIRLTATEGERKSSNTSAELFVQMFDNLTTNTNYTFRARAWGSKGYGGWSTEISIRTIEGLPGPPESMKVVTATVSSLSLRWTEPRFTNGVLKNYKLTCTPVFSYNKTVNSSKEKYKVQEAPSPNSKQIDVTTLVPATEYSCSLEAQTSVGYGSPITVSNWTKSKREEKIPKAWVSSAKVEKTTSTTITLSINEIKEKVLRYGKVKAVQIGIKLSSAKLMQKRRKRAAGTVLTAEEHTSLTGYKAAKKSGQTSYIAAELPADYKGSFIIGDNKNYGGYYNPPLVAGETYNILLGIVTTAGGFTSISFIRLDEKVTVGGISMGVSVGVPIAILIILAAVIVPVVLLIRRRRKEPRDPLEHVQLKPVEPVVGQEDEVDGPPEGACNLALITESSPQTDRSIPCSDILKKTKEMRKDESDGFKEEFKELPPDLVKPCTIGQRPPNKKRNRYQNIVAYDHTRVVLQPVSPEDKINSDYINANFIDGYGKKKAFIASQGPKDPNIVDMWRMIWQEKCSSVVMLTNIKEGVKDKCSQYWPVAGTVTHGPFQLTLRQEKSFTDYVKRAIKVTLNGESRLVTQYHLIVWPDHGVPQFASSLLNLRATVMKDYGDNYGKAPMVIHCSAGVGRTGTFIAIDYLIRQGRAEKNIDVFGCVLQLREQRPNMVQNMGQYEHVHDAVADYFLIGITNMPTPSFPEKYKKLTTVPSGKSKCKLEVQYTLMAAFSKFVTHDKEMLAEFADRNRDPDIIPAEWARPLLSIQEQGWDNYINAVYLTGYGDKDNYIATQMPFPHTINDFWRLVDDMDMSTIVMMNTVKENDELCPIYWPNESEQIVIGRTIVECKNVDTSHASIDVRHFEVSKEANARGVGGKPARTVCHFHLQNWPDGQTTPESPQSIVELLEKVEKWQQQIENKKILLQCLDGASQSGLFCAAHSVIEKVKVDHEVDVFQYVRLLRTNRPQLVNTFEQYKFVHDVVMNYLAQFDIYANFQ